MKPEAGNQKLTLDVSAETLERIEFLAADEGCSVIEMANKLLAEEAEAQAGLARGPLRRKYMYR
jgi:hypothetical protein